MEEEPPSPEVIDLSHNHHQRRRHICSNCSRPGPVCLCPYLPGQPIPTQTHVVVLLHPHEARHKLSTTPILTRCLSNSSAVISRRLRPGLSPLLDQSPPAIYLFPSADPAAVRLQDLLRDHRPPPAVVVVFDATWKHAREMVKASEGYLGNFATRVFLEFDEGLAGGGIYDSDLVLRKEPFGGCVSTLEAVARTLRVLEPNGPEIEDRLILVLREMVRLQAQFLKPTKPRPKLEKKTKNKLIIETQNKDKEEPQ